MTEGDGMAGSGHSLESLLALQRERRACHVHLVDVGREDFRLAHTDDEREAGTNTEACPVHQWLCGMSGPPAVDGVYVVIPHVPDAYSESYPVPSYELLPLDLVDLNVR
ncbi:MAG TPA: hypothetical protein VN213_13515 [Solirubrobacteraceae bacterium]|nr:hypothetical protein [Solirubrobacteraceae bacterium]